MSHPRKNILNSLGWSFIDNLSGTGINFVVGILLARQLSPAEFGLIGIALIFISFSNVIIDGGFSNALIRSSSVSEQDYATTLVINLCLGGLLYGAFFLLAPLIALYFKQDELTDIIRVLGVVLIIGSLTIVPKVRLTKALDFKTQASVSVISTGIGAAIGLSMAYSGFGVWSLVALQICRQSLYALLLRWKVRATPLHQFSITSTRRIFSYGGNILLSGLVDNLYNNLYNFTISKVYSAKHFGLYSRSEQFTSVFAINFAVVLQKVSLPALTECHDDLSKMTALYRKMLTYSGLLSCLVFLTFCACADRLIPLLIGNQWTEAIPIIRVLCLAAVFQTVIVINQNILQVFGLSRLFFRIELGKKLFAVLLVALSLWQGFVYLIWSVPAIALFSFCVNSYYGSRQLPQHSFVQQIFDMGKYMIAFGANAYFIFRVGQFFPSPLWGLIIQLLVAAVSCFLLVRLLFRKEYAQIHHLILNKLKA